MANKDDAQRWLAQAKRDILSAKSLCKDELYEVSCFHCQQAAEKAVKAFLYSKGIAQL